MVPTLTTTKVNNWIKSSQFIKIHFKSLLAARPPSPKPSSRLKSGALVWLMPFLKLTKPPLFPWFNSLELNKKKRITNQAPGEKLVVDSPTTEFKSNQPLFLMSEDSRNRSVCGHIRSLRVKYLLETLRVKLRDHKKLVAGSFSLKNLKALVLLI